MSEPHRLHPAAVVPIAFRIARELAIPALIPIVLRLFRDGFDAIGLEMALLVLGGVVILLGVSGLYGLLAWRRYTYRVEDGELRVEQGIINRKRRYIPLERIQAVDLAQGVLQRILGIVSVRVETAGGGGARAEVFLPGVSRDDGERLQQALVARPATIAAAGAGQTRRVPTRRLPVADLLLAGSTAGRAGVALPIIVSMLTLADDALTPEDVAGLSARLTGLAVMVVLALVIAATIWLLGLTGTVLAHSGFTLTRTDDTLLIERGLLERRRATIPLARIQAVRIVEDILRQPFGLAELRVESAGYGKMAGESTVLFPLLRRHEILPFLRDMAPALGAEADIQRLPIRARRRYALQLGLIIPALVFGAIFGVLLYPEGLGALLIAPGTAALLGLWQYHDSGWVVTGDTLLLRSRRLTRTTVIVPRQRVQQVHVRQTPFQRRVTLATFVVRVASGSGGSAYELSHMDAEDAVRLLSWLSAKRKDGEKKPSRCLG